MKKTILILTGSPRKGGNSDLMADAFAKGAIEAGHEILRFDAGRKKIGGCKACKTCYSKGVACSYMDDFNELAPMMEQADMLVLVSPLYFYTFTAQIKAAMDKMYALLIGNRPLHIEESVLLTCGETNDINEFDGIVKTYEIVANYMKWQDLGKVIAMNVDEKGDIINTTALDEALQLGRTISE